MSKIQFEDLPIIFPTTERKDQGWTRRGSNRIGTIRELLNTWDIDDEKDQTEMAQVLRHLRRLMQ